MIIRNAIDLDWPSIYTFYAIIMAEGKTDAFPPEQTLEEARPWWMEQLPPGQTVVALKDDVIVGSAKMGANRPGRGSHVATASFLVDPAHQGQGVGRALGQYVLDWCHSAGFTSIQFNAVVESNGPAVHLWQSLGFEIIGTCQQRSTIQNTVWLACTSCSSTSESAEVRGRRGTMARAHSSGSPVGASRSRLTTATSRPDCGPSRNGRPRTD